MCAAVVTQSLFSNVAKRRSYAVKNAQCNSLTVDPLHSTQSAMVGPHGVLTISVWCKTVFNGK